jgi:hypothetical protein
VITPERDIPLLRQVRNSRFVSHQQLFELLHQQGVGSSRTLFNWRVRRLIRSQHIVRLEALTWQGSPVYSIAPNGLMELEGQGEFAIALHSRTRHMPHRIQVFHALELNAIRLVMAQTAVLLAWQSEIEIVSRNLVSDAPYQKDYDAVVRIWTAEGEREFGLEYERSLKSAKRYAKIRAALEGERRLSSILYLTASPDLTLALIYQLTPSSIPIAFATARSFRERNLATRVSVDASGRTLTLNSFLDYASAQYSSDKSSEIST